MTSVSNQVSFQCSQNNFFFIWKTAAEKKGITMCGKMVCVSFKAQGRLLVFLRFTLLSKHYPALKGKKPRHFLHRDLTCSKAPMTQQQPGTAYRHV